MKGNLNKCQSGRCLILKSDSDAYFQATPFRTNCKKIQIKTVTIVGQQVKFSNQQWVEELCIHQAKYMVMSEGYYVFKCCIESYKT